MKLSPFTVASAYIQVSVTWASALMERFCGSPNMETSSCSVVSPFLISESLLSLKLFPVEAQPHRNTAAEQKMDRVLFMRVGGEFGYENIPKVCPPPPAHRQYLNSFVGQ